ncbi:hypothetical protein [Pedobacter heparinus]|uniref:hypothetical protein n=1 Tax=Pedobacter heparinus TaxID=984 RepID=UPI0029311109|nr:hypothetical protein [Pedobacter heparinus]
MISTNLLLAHFWANSNKIATPTGVELDLIDDETISLSVTLRNQEEYPERYQLKARFGLAQFIDTLELEQLEDLDEISIETMFTLMVIGSAGYKLFRV